MDRSSILPREFGEEWETETDALCIAAPGLEVERGLSADPWGGEGLPTGGENAVVTEFYDGWQRASESDREAFLDALESDETAIAVVARPWRLDWLLVKGDLSPDFLERFDSALHLRYDPEQDIEAAVNRALEVDGRRSRDDVRSDFIEEPRFKYTGHDPVSDELRDAVGEYEATLLPDVVQYAAGSVSDDGGLVESARSVGSDVGLDGFVEGVKGVGRSALSGTAVQITDPVMAAVGFFSYLRLQDGKTSDAYGKLFERRALPHERERVEQAFRLPPSTLDRIGSLSRGELPDVVESDLLTDDQFEEVIQEYETELDRFDETVSDIEAMIERRTSRAVVDLSELAVTVEREESNLLGRDVPVGEIEYETRSDDRGDRREAIKDALDDSDLVVLKGPDGTGKTTAAYDALREYETKHPIRAVDFKSGDAPYIEDALRRTDGQPIVYLQYEYGEYTVWNRDAFEDLYAFLAEGVCSTVVVEVRSERYKQFKDTAKKPLQARSDLLSWSDRVDVEFGRFEHDGGQIERIAERALRTVGVASEDEESFEQAVEAVVGLAEGTPEFAKIAARLVAEGETPLSDVETIDELVWQDVQNSLDLDDDTTAGCVLRRLSAFGVLTTDQLGEMCGDPTSATEIVQYIGGEGRAVLEDDPIEDDDIALGKERWTVLPDLYADVLFRNFVFNPDKPTESQDPIRTYVTAAEHAPATLLPRLAGRTGTVFRAAVESEKPDLRAEVVNTSEAFVNKLGRGEFEDKTYFESIRSLLFAGVPVPPDRIDAETLASGVAADVERTGHDPETILGNVAARLLSNHVERDGSDPNVDDLVSVWVQRTESDEEQFVANVYSMALANLADDYDPAEVDDWITRIQRLVAQDARQFDRETFVENVYSMALRSLADDYDPAEVDDWITRIQRLVAQDARQFDRETFVENVYSMALRSLADDYDPAEVDNWITRIQRLVAQDARQFDPPSKFVANVYSMALKKLADDYDPAEVDDWITRIQRLVAQDARQFDRETFVENVYSMALRSLADDYDPAEVDDWITRIQRLVAQDARQFDRETFVENVYSMALKKLADDYDPAEVDDWITRIQRLVAQDARQFDPPSKFVANVYSMALKKLADDYDPAEVDDWITRIQRLVAQDARQFDRETFVENVYSMALKKLADDYDPAEVDDWIGVAERSARESPVFEHEEPAVAAVYHTAVVRMVAEGSDPAIPRWLIRFEAALQRGDRRSDALVDGFDVLWNAFRQLDVDESLAEEVDFLASMYFRAIGLSTSPTPLFRSAVSHLMPEAQIVSLAYAHQLRNFDVGESGEADLAAHTAAVLNGIVSGREERRPFVKLVAREIRHLDIDRDEFVEGVRRRLRSDHGAGATAWWWKREFVESLTGPNPL